MAVNYKNIVITPNIGSSTGDPTIQFSGGNATVNTDITLRVYPEANGTLSFEGSAGQLFSITNDLTGSIFSVNDVSGIPSIDVQANGFISIAPFGGNVSFDSNTLFIDSVGNEVGIGTTTPISPFHVLTSENFNTSTFESSGSEVKINLRNTSTNGRQYSIISGGASGGFSGGQFGIYDDTSAIGRYFLTNGGSSTFVANTGARWIIAGKTLGLSNDTGIYSDGSNNLQFAARDGSNNLRVVIDSNPSAVSYINAGNVGIGRTTAGHRLDVNGTVNAAALLVNGSPLTSGGGGTPFGAFGLTY